MNRTTYTFLLKSIFIFCLFVFQLQAFCVNTYYTKKTGTINFNDVSSWSLTPDGKAGGPSLNELSGVTPANFFVQQNTYVYMPKNSIKVASLSLGNSGNVYMNECTLEVIGDVSIGESAVIDFGNLTSTLVVKGNLNGETGSTIKHEASLGVTQTLLLLGTTNTLNTFINKTVSGRSVVAYNGAEQTVFPSPNYVTLIIGGTGTKTFSVKSFNTEKATTVSRKLQLGSKLKLDTLDLVYKGDPDSLFYNDGVNFNGWVWTDNSGMMKNGSTTPKQTFPVGDGVTMKAIIFSSINKTTGLLLGVRYDASHPSIVISPNGVGVWYINTNKDFSADVTLLNPIVAPATLSVPRFAKSISGTTSSSWQTLDNTLQSSTGYGSTNNTFYNGNNYAALFDCIPPTISPTTLPTAFQDVPYSSGNIELATDRAPYKLDNSFSIPDNKDLLPYLIPFTNNKLHIEGSPTILTNYKIDFIIKDTYGCSTRYTYNIDVHKTIFPNLYINPIDAKTYGDADFKISAYTKNTTTPITYSISPSTACVELLTNNMLHITCAGPVPNNTITVTASQAAAGIYKEESVTTTFVINKARAKLSIKNTGFLPNEAGALIYEKTSDVAPTFTQLTGRDLATVTSEGKVTTLGTTGTFSVLANIVENNNYTGFDSIYVFTIYTTKQAPVAVNDTIIIQMGKDTTLNLLVNDYGITDPINATRTDIDIENPGMQKKFYSTSLGTFTIDPSGMLTINPFEGFIGSDQIGYTVADEAGLTSNIAYLVIKVEEPFKLPDLKGNEIITRNNDGLNDALVIANTNIESTNNLIITDIVGNIIFKQDNYKNDWKGSNQAGNDIGTGYYFYVFTEKNTGRMLQNSIQIVY